MNKILKKIHKNNLEQNRNENKFIIHIKNNKKYIKIIK